MAKQRTDTESVLKLVVNNEQAKASAKEIADAYRKVSTELNNMKRADDPRAYAEKAKSVRMLRDALNDAKKEVSGVTTESKKFHSSWKDIAVGMVGGFGIAGAIGIVKNFGQQVFDTTAKFQKLEAVLTTTLGSNSQAKLVMQQIQDFAAKTPFQVDELTDSYVRLANQGFRPTMEQLRSLGDLSASTGKNFNQLTEAIIDAQTGEFERLKEFGIRASKNGDQVAFTFKGVTKEVNFTADSIRDYITELGNTEGVSGSMAAISETLSGKVSNLGDSWDSLLKIVGEETEGIFSASLTIMNKAISALSQYVNDLNVAAKYDAPGTSLWARLAELPALAGMGVNVQAMQRNAFTQVSAGLDKQIAEAKTFRELIDIQEDLKDRLKRVDKSTTEGAAAWNLYADKLKLVKDRSQSIKAERLAEEMKKNSEAAKKAAEASEKQRKEAEKLSKAQQKALEKEYEGLVKLAEEMQADFNLEGLEGLDRKLAEIDNKYLPLIEKAKAFKDLALAGTFTNIMNDKKGMARKSSWEEEGAEDEKARKESFAYEKGLVDDKYTADSNSLNSALASDLIGVTDEERRLEIQEAYQEKERALTEEHLLVLKGLYESYGENSAEIDTKLNSIKLENIENDFKSHQKNIEAKRLLEQTYVDLTLQSTNAIQELFSRRTAIYKAALLVESAYNIAKITMDTQAEIKGYWKTYAGIPGGQIIAGILTGMAVTRSGLAIAKVIKAATMSGGETKQTKMYRKGGVPEGPSHEQGGIKLVDGITGNLIGEMEGGERILSREDTRLVDDMIYGKQRQLSSRLSVNASGILEAERLLRYGDRTQMTGTTASSSVVNNNTTVINTKSLEDKMDRFIDAAENAWNYRMFEKNKKRFDEIRDDLNS